ncbi:MAG TPA: FtsX-like permease family protein, partial [Spirochaetia bacterium]|nr:FtsX-like permease family protein [Spirochaetia bacterium]
LATDLGAELGDVVEIRTRTKDGVMQTLSLEIVGIINSPNPVINKGTGFLPFSVAQRDLVMEGAVTEIVLSLPGGKEVEDTVNRINTELRSSFPELTALTWLELAEDFVAMAEMKTKGSSLLILMIFIIAAVGISNTMLIAVYERVREIGMMRALGMKDSSIRLAFLLEAGGIGFLGSTIGLVLGSIATYFMVNWGIDYSSIIGQMDIGYRVTGVFRAAWHPQAMVNAVILGTLISMGVALLPASRALRMKITDCLRYE